MGQVGSGADGGGDGGGDGDHEGHIVDEGGVADECFKQIIFAFLCTNSC